MCLPRPVGLARRFVDAVPDHLRGRAFGLVTTGMTTTQGAAATAAGALAEILAPGLVIAAAGAPRSCSPRPWPGT